MTDLENKARAHYEAGGTMAPDARVEDLLSMIDELRACSITAEQEIANLKKELSERCPADCLSHQSNHYKTVMNKLKDENETLREERHERSNIFGELLSVIHRDGGQYLITHGFEKATIDALDKFHKLTYNKLEPQKSFIDIKYEHETFVECRGYGRFSLRQLDKNRWSIDLNDEHIELYNKRGRHVRSNLNHDGDW